MKRNKTLHVVLAGIGCVSLLVYILACSTSFSPDDSQVLYPAFDKQSGAISVAVYDRQTGRSENIFTAIAPGESATNQDRLLTRSQWLLDGKHILISHVLGNDTDKGLALHLLARGVDEPLRYYPIVELEDPLAALEFPLAVAGSRVVLRLDETNLVSLDLMTGLGMTRAFSNEVFALPGPDGDSIVGLADLSGPGDGTVFGSIDPRTLEFTPALKLTNSMTDGIFPTFDPRDGRLVFVSGESTNLHLHVVKDAQTAFRRPVERHGVALSLGPWLDLGPHKDRVFTTYISEEDGAKDAEYGVVEIPLNQDPLRWIPLFHARAGDDDELLYAQASLSHDGQTWAIATSYLYLQNESIKPEDCALFLVDVGRAEPKITKVPIAPPLRRTKLAN